MQSLREQVRRTIEDHDLIPSGSRVVVAVSGGSDSVALLQLLHELVVEGAFQLVALAHLNHQLRGKKADEDEKFCRKLATTFSIQIEVESVDVRALARTRRTSIEDAARYARYAFFDRVASRVRADRVAVGHTRDDQAETFLLRLMRGAGPRGLAGIYPRMGLVVRPLLDVRRRQLRAYLDSLEAEFQEDETNFDVRIPRNRVRHELLPYIERYLTPGIVDVLARDATIARRDAEWLDCSAQDAAKRLTLHVGGSLEIDVNELGALPAAIARRVIHLALADAARGRFIGFNHVEIVMQFMTRAPRTLGPVDLPGHSVRLTNGKIVLTPRASADGLESSPDSFFDYQLSIPGEVHVEEAGLAISAQPAAAADYPEYSKLNGSGDCVAIRSAVLSSSLRVRNWQPGDRFRPPGLGGHKKLQDLFVDRKVLRSVRRRVPLVVDHENRIIWIVGLALEEDFLVTDHTQAMVVLKVRRLGGLA